MRSQYTKRRHDAHTPTTAWLSLYPPSVLPHRLCIKVPKRKETHHQKIQKSSPQFVVNTPRSKDPDSRLRQEERVSSTEIRDDQRRGNYRVRACRAEEKPAEESSWIIVEMERARSPARNRCLNPKRASNVCTRNSLSLGEEKKKFHFSSPTSSSSTPCPFQFVPRSLRLLGLAIFPENSTPSAALVTQNAPQFCRRVAEDLFSAPGPSQRTSVWLLSKVFSHVDRLGEK